MLLLVRQCSWVHGRLCQRAQAALDLNILGVHWMGTRGRWRGDERQQVFQAAWGSFLCLCLSLCLPGEVLSTFNLCLEESFLTCALYKANGNVTPPQGCRHLWEIWMAAAGAAELSTLRLLWCRDQSVNFHGLERMTSLTSLKLERGFLRGLPPQVTALKALQELELCEVGRVEEGAKRSTFCSPAVPFLRPLHCASLQ